MLDGVMRLLLSESGALLLSERSFLGAAGNLDVLGAFGSWCDSPGLVTFLVSPNSPQLKQQALSFEATTANTLDTPSAMPIATAWATIFMVEV